MSFEEDLVFESQFYEAFVKPYLEAQGYSVHWVTDMKLQKRDIDATAVKLGVETTISIKTSRKILPCIFFETVSNDVKGTPGWGLYSKADRVIYGYGDFNSGLPDEYKVISFTLRGLRRLDMSQFPEHSIDNEYYHTKGHAVPLTRFTHKVLAMEV